jgi:hypothetical protein
MQAETLNAYVLPPQLIAATVLACTWWWYLLANFYERRRDESGKNFLHNIATTGAIV